MYDLIAARQLPVSPSLLQSIQENASQRLKDAQSLVCTPESLLPVKSARAETQKEYDALEEWRKEIKEWVMAEYKKFDADYKAATKDHVDALSLYSSNIKQTEDAIKRECEDGLRDYFSELCAVRHLDWLEYERAGIKVDMASAKAKTPKKLRERLEAWADHIYKQVNAIQNLDDAAEIMEEYKKSLDFAGAIDAVRNRKLRIEQERAAKEARKAVLEQEAEAIRRVEALAAPESVPIQKQDTIRVSLVLHPTKDQFEEKIKPIMRQLKQICDMEGIKYE